MKSPQYPLHRAGDRGRQGNSTCTDGQDRENRSARGNGSTRGGERPGLYRYPNPAFNQTGLRIILDARRGVGSWHCSDLEEEDSKSHPARPLALFPDPSNPGPHPPVSDVRSGARQPPVSEAKNALRLLRAGQPAMKPPFPSAGGRSGRVSIDRCQSRLPPTAKRHPLLPIRTHPGEGHTPIRRRPEEISGLTHRGRVRPPTSYTTSRNCPVSTS